MTVRVWATSGKDLPIRKIYRPSYEHGCLHQGCDSPLKFQPRILHLTAKKGSDVESSRRETVLLDRPSIYMRIELLKLTSQAICDKREPLAAIGWSRPLSPSLFKHLKQLV
jgi:hypothetical protein